MLPQIGDVLRTHLASRLLEGASVRLLASHEEPPAEELCIGLRLFDATVASLASMGLHRNDESALSTIRIDALYLAIVYAPTATQEHALLESLLETVFQQPLVTTDEITLRLVTRAVPLELRLAARHLMALPCVLIGATPTTI